MIHMRFIKNIIPFGAILFLSCHASDSTDADKNSTASEEIILTAEQLKGAAITTGPATKQEMRSELVVSGVVDVPPQNKVSVSFPLGGFLASTQLMPGMHVSKGEVIARIEDQSLIQLQQEYLTAQARQEYLEQEYQRQKELHEHQVNAEKVFQQATADRNSNLVLLKSFAEKLRLAGLDPVKLNTESISRSVALRSPINGFVSAVNVNPGKYVQPTDVLFELIDPDDVHAALSVFEKDMGKVAIGQRVSISFVDEPDNKYEGEVILVTRNVDEQRSGTIHCHFVTRPPKLLPGMFLRARIQLSHAQVVAVPEAAVVASQGKQYIFEESTPGHFKPVDITIGTRSDGFIEWSNAPSDALSKHYVLTNGYAVMGAWKGK
jgi:membrane fusion protein, heavy metal efflux system